jgi:diaminopimelate epimerase
MTLEFSKYEGLGNDFLVVEVAHVAALGPGDATRLCDRHLGVGGDGVLLLAPGETPGSAGRMVVLNADGSRPEMCGNGVRCVALHLARAADVTSGVFRVDTDAGVKECAVERVADAALVSVWMGRGSALGKHSAQLGSDRVVFEKISMGNPHAVVFGREYPDVCLDQYGAQVSAELPGGSNVEFARLVTPQHIELVVWERGVGRTQACGTGACATAVAAVLAGLSPYSKAISVDLPGGRLEVEVAPETLEVTMRGPARLVFSGRLAAGAGGAGAGQIEHR